MSTTSIIQELYSAKQNDRIQKPDFNTKIGREFLAFYLSTKFKQIVAYDKKHNNNFFLHTNSDFLSNFLKKIVNKPDNSITLGIFGDFEGAFCDKIKNHIEELGLPVIVTEDFSELLNDHKIVILRCKDSIQEECKSVLDIKIYTKKKKERTENSSDYDITANGECCYKYLGEIIKYIKLITNDFSPADESFLA